jgi:Ca-activated chloride channel homolog
MRSLLAVGLAVLVCSGIAVAQKLRGNVHLHQMIVTVTDDRGSYIADLKPSDVVLEVNGAARQIDLFTQDADTPVTLGLLIDTSGSKDVFFDATRPAARAFIGSFRPADEFFFATFAHSITVRQGLTQDKATVSDALSGLKTAGGDTHLLSAVVSATKLVQQGRNRKRALIVLTDGIDTTCEKNLQSFKDAIRKSETLIYAIQWPNTFSPDNPTSVSILSHCSNAPGSNDFFDAIESETGGRTFPTRPLAPHFDELLDGIFDTIALELRSQYTIGFNSDAPGATLATVRIRTTHPGYHVRTSKPN